MNKRDMIGQRFGRLTVIGDSGQRKRTTVLWRCRCDCGNTCVVPSGNLKSGNTKSCGCGKRDAGYLRRDLTGQRFGRLTALYPVKKERQNTVTNAVWRCRCDCGNETDAYSSSLLAGRTRSCGCLNREQMSRMHEHLHYGNGTCVELLNHAQKGARENRAGFRGLFRTKDGRFRVTITFQKVRYNLGYYRDYDEAVQVRLDAEETLHQGYIDAWEAYQHMAEADPAWAEENPFVYQVTRSKGGFQVYTNTVAATV